VERSFLDALPKWEGDKIFLDLLWQDAPFFLLTLRYNEDKLTEAVLNGKKIR
jgi:8-oxo-dGTP diphosphatase